MLHVTNLSPSLKCGLWIVVLRSQCEVVKGFTLGILKYSLTADRTHYAQHTDDLLGLNPLPYCARTAAAAAALAPRRALGVSGEGYGT